MSIDAQKLHKQVDARPAYPDLPVPSTPLEHRLGPHPKKDYLIWKSPPTRQLSREKRREFEADVTERFYDDYIGTRSTGDAKNDVMTGLSKLHFHPEHYRLNAVQTFAYDPARPVPRGIDLNQMVRDQTERERGRLRSQGRQRRYSAPQMSYQTAQYLPPSVSSVPQLPPVPGNTTRKEQHFSKNVDQKLLNESVRPDMVAGVEDWIASASAHEKETATKFLRTISSHGQRPVDPASKATRVRSAVLTPNRTQRPQRPQQQMTVEFKQLEREMAGQPREPRARRDAPRRKVKRSLSASHATQGMFSPVRQQPAHFTVHPEWASESLSRY